MVLRTDESKLNYLREDTTTKNEFIMLMKISCFYIFTMSLIHNKLSIALQSFCVGFGCWKIWVGNDSKSYDVLVEIIKAEQTRVFIETHDGC